MTQKSGEEKVGENIKFSESVKKGKALRRKKGNIKNKYCYKVPVFKSFLFSATTELQGNF